MAQSPTASAGFVGHRPDNIERESLAEAQRQLDICNACRYCEGLCAVFPALERRSIFAEGDVLFLANLCHDCRHCFDACPFASPHEFHVDLPPLMSAIREETYRSYARPRWVRPMMRSHPERLRAFLIVLTTTLCVLVGLSLIGWERIITPATGPGAFYDIVPFAAMTVPALVLSMAAVGAMTAGVVKYWRDTTWRGVSLGALLRTTSKVVTLENMRGGGPGCTYPSERPQHSRRILHAMVFYGFLGTFVATMLAAIWQEVLGQLPPYPVLSPPVLVGTLGGVSTTAGCLGLLVLKFRTRKGLDSGETRRMDFDFIFLLLVINLTGLALLTVRSTSAMGPLLLVHLALVAAFFVGLPYGKFVHATYRIAALLQNEIEEQADAIGSVVGEDHGRSPAST